MLLFFLKKNKPQIYQILKNKNKKTINQQRTKKKTKQQLRIHKKWITCENKTTMFKKKNTKFGHNSCHLDVGRNIYAKFELLSYQRILKDEVFFFNCHDYFLKFGLLCNNNCIHPTK